MSSRQRGLEYQQGQTSLSLPPARLEFFSYPLVRLGMCGALRVFLPSPSWRGV